MRDSTRIWGQNDASGERLGASTHGSLCGHHGEQTLVGLTSSATGHGSFEVRLPPQPASVSEARAHVRGLLESTGREDLVETAVLLVSEVVTNALLHAGTDIDVAAALDDSGLRIEVGDGSPHLPSRRRYAATAGTGRGLLMLEAARRRLGRHPAPRREDGVVPDLRPRQRPARRDGAPQPTSRAAPAADATTCRWSSATCRCCCTPPGRSTPRRCCGSTSWRTSTPTTRTRSRCTPTPPTRSRCSRSTCRARR